jgi:hypothetical protein
MQNNFDFYLTLGHNYGVRVDKKEHMDYIEISELLEFLADLTIYADDFETALGALKLQTAIQEYYWPSR